MRVLVAYGSTRGGTAGLAEMIGQEFESKGYRVVVQAARTVRRADDFDAVVVAGALYAARWHKDARGFVRRHAKELRGRPVWFVSSGPLDASAREKEIPPTRQVARLMGSVGARGHVTFGGRLEPDAKGFPAAAMAKKYAGDWRDPAHVHEWVAAVAGELKAAREAA